MDTADTPPEHELPLAREVEPDADAWERDCALRDVLRTMGAAAITEPGAGSTAASAP